MTNIILGEFTEKNINHVQLLRAGTFNIPGKGSFTITKKDIINMKNNFVNFTAGVTLSIDYSHESGRKAAGDIVALSIENGGTELWIDVEWTPTGQQKVVEKEFKYLSADIALDFEDNETGEKHGMTLRGAGLTNRPVIKRMEALLSEDANQPIEFERLLLEIQELDDEQKALVQDALNTNPKKDEEMTEEVIASEQAEEEKPQVVEDKVELGEKKPEAEKQEIVAAEAIDALELSEKVTKLENQLKNKDFDLFLSEGKAVEAQRDAYMCSDIKAYVAGQVHLHLSEQGSSGTKAKKEEVETAESAQVKLSDLADELVDKNSIPFSEAYKRVCKDNADLFVIAENKQTNQ